MTQRVSSQYGMKNQRVANVPTPNTMAGEKKNVAQGFIIAATSLAIILGVTLLKAHADKPTNAEYQEGE